MEYKDVKRILDILVSFCFIIILSPVLLITGLVVGLESEGPIIFKQKRLGKNGNLFEIYKFRSMKRDNDLLNFQEKDKVTKIGKFIRKYGIDELPQLFNILKGDMSLIGPRPQIPKYISYYSDNEKRRFNVLPGILGPNTSQHTKKSILEKNKLDVYYAENLSLKEDVKIIFTTIKNIFKILEFREDGALGNKTNVEEELLCLENNMKLNDTFTYKLDVNNVIELNDTVINVNDSVIDKSLTRKRKNNYGK